jgi:phosphocarrier protein HPr
MERVVESVPEAGLHARPAAKFVETANEYDAEITVAPVADGEDAEAVAASSMIAVTSLGVKNGEEVRLSAEGEDAEAALDALEEVLSTPEEGDGED